MAVTSVFLFVSPSAVVDSLNQGYQHCRWLLPLLPWCCSTEMGWMKLHNGSHVVVIWYGTNLLEIDIGLPVGRRIYKGMILQQTNSADR